MLRFCVFSFFVLLMSFSLHAQPLWSCDGSIIFTIDGKLFINNTAPGDLDISLNELPLPSFGDINGIAYRRADNCIYGVDNNVEPLRRIFRLSPMGEYEIIDTIPDFDGALLAGTMSFNDQYLILPHGFNFILVDVTDNSAAPTVIPLSRTDITFGFVDVALDAYTGKVHGLSTETGTFVVIDPVSGIVEDDYTLPLSLDFPAIPGIGFTDQQTLVGISGNSLNDIIGFYHPNSETVIAEVAGIIAVEDRSSVDACSCVDFDLVLQHTLSSDTLKQCQTASAVIHIINRSQGPLPGSNFVLKDTFPTGVIIEEVTYNPFPGEVEGVGTNIFQLSNFNPGFGIDSIVLQLTVTEDALLGAHEVQAFMEGFMDLVEYPSGHLLSDNPRTYESVMDATPFIIIGSDSLASVQTQYYLCPDSSVVIDPVGNQSGYDLAWEDGSVTDARLITEEGQYTATISDACITQQFAIQVEEVFLEVDLGADQTIVLGEEIVLNAQIDNDLPISTYSWLVNDTLIEFCNHDCIDFNFAFEESALVELLLVDENGCSARSEMEVTVDIALFAPNAFSPNHDGLNDWFYLQSAIPIPFVGFRIYDRWGGLLFDQASGYTNDPLQGWDGTSHLKEASQGVYLWEVTLRLGNSRSEKRFSGSLTLLK